MKRGKTAISGSDVSVKVDVLPFIPRLHATLEPGDFMYNPDWYAKCNARGEGLSLLPR